MNAVGVAGVPWLAAVFRIWLEVFSKRNLLNDSFSKSAFFRAYLSGLQQVQRLNLDQLKGMNKGDRCEENGILEGLRFTFFNSGFTSTVASWTMRMTNIIDKAEYDEINHPNKPEIHLFMQL